MSKCPNGLTCLSGDGAARFGGRWTPRGVPAIYAARELSTAWAEYNQGFVQHPAVIAQLELTGASLADLIDESVLAKLGADTDIQRCEWRAEQDRGAVPATHMLYQRLLALIGSICPWQRTVHYRYTLRYHSLSPIHDLRVLGSRPSGSTTRSVGPTLRFQRQSATHVPPGDMNEDYTIDPPLSPTLESDTGGGQKR